MKDYQQNVKCKHYFKDVYVLCCSLDAKKETLDYFMIPQEEMV